MDDEINKMRLDLGLALNQAEEYKQRYLVVQKDNQSLKTENESLRSQLNSMQSIKGLDGRQADELRRTLQQYQQDNEDLKRQITQLNNQQNQLQQQSMFLPVNNQQQQQINQLQQEKAMFQQNYDMAQSQLEEKTRAYNQLKVRLDARDFIAAIPIGQEANKIMVLGKENQRLNEQLVLKDQEIEDYKNRIFDQQNLSQQNEQLTAQLRKYQDTVITLSGEVERLLTEVGGLRYDVVLKQDLDRKKKELNDLSNAHRELKGKYDKLYHESSDIGTFKKQVEELESRLSQMMEQNQRLELENRGIQVKLQNYDRLLKDKDGLEKKIQELESEKHELDIQQKDKSKQLEIKKKELDEKEAEFLRFKDVIHLPAMERQKRLEFELENWRNKCLALENNFFGNSERQYINQELQRLNNKITELQKENDDLKVQLRKPKVIVQSGVDSANEERTKLLYAERERLFGEIEQLRRKNVQLENDLAKSSRSPAPQQIQIIQEREPITQIRNREKLDDDNELLQQVQMKDRQLEDLKEGIEKLIDENKSLKQEIDTLQFQVEQLDIEKSYLQQRQFVNQKENNQFEMLARMSGNEGDIRVRAWEQLARRLYDELREKNQSYQNQSQDQQFFQMLQAKEKELDQMKRKFSEFQRIGDSNQIYVNELKKLRDVLEQKSYEAQEWKEKYQQVQSAQRQNDNLGNNSILEAEFRKLRQLHEMKVRENDELKSRVNAQDIGGNNKESESELRKLKTILQMRTTECEEWRQKYLRLNDAQYSAPIQARDNSSELNRIQQLYEQKHNDHEELKMKYTQLAKTKDKNVANVIDDLQNEVKKHQKLHEQKSFDLQDLHNKSQNTLKERDLLEKELRRVKGILEDQINENEQLKRKLQQTPISPATGNNSVELEKQYRELLQKYNQLQSEAVNKHMENDRLKQNNVQQQNQFKSVAMDANNKDQRLRDLTMENDKMKGIIDQKQRECEEMKSQLQKLSQTANNLNNQLQDVRKNTPPVEQMKAQMQIQLHQIQEGEKKVSQLQNELQKVANILKDKQIENEKLKGQFGQIDSQKRDKDMILQQLNQLKQQYEQKGKENDQMRQALQQAQKKIQELTEKEATMRRAQEQLQQVLGNIGKR